MLQYLLLDKKTDLNSFFINADGKEDHDKKLDFTYSHGLVNPFFFTDEKGVRIYKRYIQGCPTYDPAEQEKQKIVATRQNSVVEFVKGAPIVLDETKGKILADWLDMHPENPASPYHDAQVHEACFYKHDPKKVVEQEMDSVKDEDEALEILRVLRKSPERMKSIAVLFEKTKNLIDEQEIYLGLRKAALENPVDFKDSIANRENEILAEVLKAEKYNVINKDAKGFFYEDSKGQILENSVKDMKAANSQLVTYLMSKEGDIHLRQILIKNQQYEIGQTNPVS